MARVKKKILVVDDDQNMRRAIRRLLYSEGKYDIQEAYNGVDAERKIKEFLPDLIILDIKMPRKGGYEVCLTLRDTPQIKYIKIIGISGFAGKVGKSIMEALGADYFFEKPFDNEKFKNKIDDFLNEG